MFFDLVFCLVAYLLGSFPSAYLTSRFFSGTDVTLKGSGNLGGMNVIRNVGWVPGLVTVLLDLAKGALAVRLAQAYGSWPSLPLLAAVLVVLGHNYMVFLGLRGGKGFAAVTGALLMLRPEAVLLLLVTMGLAILILRDANLGAGVGTLSLPLIFWWLNGTGTAAAIGLLASVAIMSRHRADFEAYRRGRRQFL